MKGNSPPPPASQEIAEGKRFAWGKNWQLFLQNLTEARIRRAEKYLLKMLGLKSLAGKRFCDIGCGSGLFSLAAHRLGAKVYSLDFDPGCVWCANQLRSRYGKSAPDWQIAQGSVLDNADLAGLGAFDIVYSWGVLHHTGEMWRAIFNASRLVRGGGMFYIAIYNDQGLQSRLWWLIKYTSNRLPRFLRPIYALGLDAIVVALLSVKYTLRFKLFSFLRERLYLSEADDQRGIAVYATEVYDWYGGLPFEYAAYDHIKDFVEGLDFTHIRGKQVTSLGCNEFVFRRTGDAGRVKKPKPKGKG